MATSLRRSDCQRSCPPSTVMVWPTIGRSGLHLQFETVNSVVKRLTHTYYKYHINLFYVLSPHLYLPLSPYLSSAPLLG